MSDYLVVGDLRCCNTDHRLEVNSIYLLSEASYVPVPQENDFGPVMNLYQRGWNLLRNYMDRLVVYEHVYRVNTLLRESRTNLSII